MPSTTTYPGCTTCCPGDTCCIPELPDTLIATVGDSRCPSIANGTTVTLTRVPASNPARWTGSFNTCGGFPVCEVYLELCCCVSTVLNFGCPGSDSSCNYSLFVRCGDPIDPTCACGSGVGCNCHPSSSCSPVFLFYDAMVVDGNCCGTYPVELVDFTITQ